MEDLRDKTHRGMAGQIGRGMSAGGRPYGYRSVPILDNSRRDAYGQPTTSGYRKVIDEVEARVVRRIFEMYASGLSSKTIAHRLNSDHVMPPRPKRGRTAQGWTWTTISGSAKRSTGILNNGIYIGQISWNRTRKERNPETGRRVPRQRSRDEWLKKEDPSLRIVSDELWERVKARQRDMARRTKGRKGGAQNVPHLFSGLLRCGQCGGSYTQRDRRHLACSFHRNRGPQVCPNGKVVRREDLERRLLAAIQDDFLARENLAYLTRKVNEVLERLKSQGTSQRRGLDAQLLKAEQEIRNIKGAVRLGRATTSLLEMLEEAEDRARRLRAEVATEPSKTRVVAKVLPQLVEQYVRDLRETLNRNPKQARSMLAALLGNVVLRPEKDGLWAEMSADLRILLDGHVDSDGAGRGI